MPLVDIALVKKHLRVDSSYEDDVIGVYQSAAETAVVEYLDRPVLAEAATLPAFGDEGYDATAIKITPAITAAILLMTGDLFATREPDDGAGDRLDLNAVLPRSVRALLAPYRVWRTLPCDAA